MATKQKDTTSRSGGGRKAPQKAASKSTSRSAAKKGTGAPKRAQPKAMAGSRSSTKSQAVPAKTRSASRSPAQGGLLNPMAWLSTLETTLTSPQARAVMAEALRAMANVLEKPQGGQGGGLQEGRRAVSAAGSLGAEIVAAPLEVAAAAVGAAGEVVTSALGGSSRESRGNGNSRKGGSRSSARKTSSAGD